MLESARQYVSAPPAMDRVIEIRNASYQTGQDAECIYLLLSCVCKLFDFKFDQNLKMEYQPSGAGGTVCKIQNGRQGDQTGQWGLGTLQSTFAK